MIKPQVNLRLSVRRILLTTNKLISIGALAKRTGTTVSALRYYSDRNLIECSRTPGGKRVYKKEVVWRVSFILIAQNLGYTLDQIQHLMFNLPAGRTPTKRNWERLSNLFKSDLNEKIDQLTKLRDSLSSCIGCGCLSLRSCQLYNAGDEVNLLGVGPRFLLGDLSRSTNK